ncbi:MAG: S41 family peptidase [Planctomycetes bacterium]|nr:S41 family peptidase [Planctomycetota bacterium]
MERKPRIGATIVLVLAVFGIFFVRFYSGFMYSEDEKWKAVYENALRTVERKHVETLSREKMTCDALEGVCSALDPFSEFFPPAEYEEFNRTMAGRFSGVGIYIRQFEDGTIAVISPIFNGPAYQEGIKPGDVIVKVDGESIEGLGLEAVSGRIKGEEGTEVVLTVRRSGEAVELEFRLVRRSIHVESVRSARLLKDRPEVGYVVLGDFQEDSPELLRKKLEGLAAAGMRKLILDVRGNGGGLLSAAVQIADMFLAGGTIVTVKYRTAPDEVEKARPGNAFEDLPMAVLVDGDSASASEILAVALQENKRAVIVGERSYGKGSVQQVFPVEMPGKRTGGVKITTARWYSPLGRPLSRLRDAEDYGVIPDYSVELPEESMEDVYEAFRNEWIRYNTGSGPEGPVLEDVDVQLKKAVEVVGGAGTSAGNAGAE